MKLYKTAFNEADLSRIVEMAWEDRTPFEAIHTLYGLNETAVIDLMRQQMQPSSFRMWRKRMAGRTTKHLGKRGFLVGRFVCPSQRTR
ncbi:TIGR03643 family protein [Thiothrix subterranea]|uniref:TIGR03643 family protein n=1 Tax=Thiothrix subterranea TaxID=2735563 RepID=UPI00192BC779|nr:TIGR03643 family protein [Thiothrix subterranea]QQZ27571.1 TIGR03643 family protein [Thiothrix subterranea]